MPTLYTIGHSTRTLDELISALQAHSIKTLIDIRSFPISRRLPHFNRESFEQALPKAGLEYIWLKELGGRRKKMRDDSPNLGLRSPGFRNYADYMLTYRLHVCRTCLLPLPPHARLRLAGRPRPYCFAH